MRPLCGQGGAMLENSSFTACNKDGDKFEEAMSPSQQEEFRANVRVMSAAFLVGVGLMGLKFYGFWITGSLGDPIGCPGIYNKCGCQRFWTGKHLDFGQTRG